MNTYIIAYDLNRPGQDYSTLIDAIKRLGSWWHYLDSAWILTSNRTATQIRDYLIPYLDTNDELIVARLAGEAAWFGFPTAGSDWLLSALAA
jgi:hypothetical protein